MANIAGGVSALGALEGAKEYRSAEAQNIQNQGAQMDLDSRRDAEKAYVAVMEARLRAAAQRKASENAQVRPGPGAQQQAVQPGGALDGAPPEGFAVQRQEVPAGAPGSMNLGGRNVMQGPTTTNQTLLDASPRYDSPETTPMAGVPSATQQADLGMLGGGSPAPAQKDVVRSATTPKPTNVMSPEDEKLSRVAKSLGVDIEALKGIGSTPGAMQGIMAANEHVEKMEKQRAQGDINKMYRTLQTHSPGGQRTGVAEYLQAHGVAGAPDDFVEATDEKGNKGWYSVHNGEKGQFIPDQGGGFLDTMTRMLYGAIDRSGTIGSGIEAESKLAPEKVKAKSALDVQGLKNKGFLDKSKSDNDADKEIAHIQGGYRVKAAGVSATAGNKAQTAADKVSAKKIDQRIKTLEQQRKGLEKDPITGQYKEPGAAKRIDQELEDLRSEITGDDSSQRSRPRAKSFTAYDN